MAILNQINLNGTPYDIGGASIVELTEYLAVGSVLPWTGLYVYLGKPISHLRVIQDGATSWTLIFCIQHFDGEYGSGSDFPTFTSSSEGWTYLETYTDANVPEWVLMAFGENIASTQFSGKMSSTDKTKLNGIPTGPQLTQLFADKQDKTPIVQVASGTTAINAQVNKYYEVAGTVSSLTVTLPTPTANTEVTMVVLHLTVGASPTILVTSVNEVVKFSAAYSVVANKEYELSCLYNGSKWIVSSMEVAV